MADWNKADNALALNNASSWIEGSIPTSSTATRVFYGPDLSQARNAALGASTTWGQFVYDLGTGAVASNITSGTAVLTLTPTSYSDIGIWVKNRNINFISPIALGSSQTWQVDGTSILGITGGTVALITGASKDLTKTGTGQLTLSPSVANTFTGNVFVNAGVVLVTTAGGLGNAANVTTVASGAALILGVSPIQTAFAAQGQGTGAQYGAIHAQASINSGRTITVSGTGPVLSFRSGTTYSGAIAASSVADLYLNMENTVDSAGAGVLFGTSAYTVSNAVHLTSIDLDGTTPRRIGYSFGTGASATDAGGGLGANSNAVVVEPTGVLLYPGSGTATLSRAYTFNGGTPVSPYYNIFLTNLGATMNFAGSVTLSGAGTKVYARGSTGAGSLGILRFSGSLAGDADLVATVVASSYLDVQLPSSLASTWTGALTAYSVKYGQAIPNAVTYSGNNTNVFIDALNAGVTLNHSSYTIDSATVLNFAGTHDLTMGTGALTTNEAALTFATAANRLTISSNVTGPVIPITKSGAGALALTGNNTAFGTVSVSAGELDINADTALGTATSALTITAGTLDNTSGTGVTIPARPLQIHGTSTWGGTRDLTIETNNSNSLTSGAAGTRNFGFSTSPSATGTLRLKGSFSGAATLGSTFNVGTSGSKARLTVDGSCAWTVAPNVNGGYYQTRDSNGLGAVASTLTWDVAATAALELNGGISTPANKTASIAGIGPNSDGALRSVAGTNSFAGPVAVLGGSGSPAKIQADDGTFTLTSASALTTAASQPLQFAAAGTATLNLDRIIPSSATTIDVNPLAETGTVKLNPATANLHTGAFTVSGGTCQLGQTQATSTSTVTVKPGARLQTVTAQGTATYTNLVLGQTGSGTTAYLKIGA